MPIRFFKSGSTFRFAAATIAASAGLWFGSATYAQTRSAWAPAPAISAATPSSQSRYELLNERDRRFSQQPAIEQSNLQIERYAGDRPQNNTYRENSSVTESVPFNRTARSGSSQVPEHVVQQLITRPAVPRQRTEAVRPQSRFGGHGNERSASAQANDVFAKLTTPKPVAAPVLPAAPVVERYSPPSTPAVTGVHQLESLSVVGFEQKLFNVFGDQLETHSSDDGRFIRVAVPNNSFNGRAAEPFIMLVDRHTGKLRYEGDPALMASWHKLLSQLDSVGTVPAQPVATADLEVEVHARPQVEQVAFQQDDPVNQGTQVQGVEGLSGPVFIARDPNGSGWTLTGAPEDVAIVRREIDRLIGEGQRTTPTPVSIPLQNARGNLIQTRVQEIYDASYAPANGPANITATDNPNALIVVGGPRAVEAVRGLVRLLDQKQVEGAARDFRTFSLKFISSNDAANRLRRFFGQVTVAPDDNRIPATAVEVIPDFRSNQVTVRGNQSILNAAEDFLRTIDVDSVAGGAVNEVKVIQLKNALASDIAFVIQNAINGGLPGAPQAFATQANGQTAQPQVAQSNVDTDGIQSQIRSAMLSFRGRDGQLTSAILFDVSITADVNSNQLVVTGPSEAIPLIVELVEQLDRIPDAESQIKVFELVYSDAQTIFDMLDALFNSQNAAANQQQAGGASQLPLQTGGGSDGASLINLRFSVEPRSNAIIASGPARDLQVIEDLLNRLDARSDNNAEAKVYRLSNAPAQDVADAINTYLDGRTDLIDNDPRTATGVPGVRRTIIVTPEVVSNSLIVSALPEYRAEIENIIKSLDRRPPMIQVKVLIAEVNLDAVEEFGVELGIQDSLLFDRGTSIAADGALTGIGFPFNTGTIPNANAAGLDSFAGQALSNLNVGRVNSSLGFGGLVLSAGNESVNVLLRALKDRQCVRVLSKPQIMTMENLQGRISIGASVARVAGTTQTNFGLTQDVEFRDVGVILEVTPRVSPDGLIVMTVNLENSAVGPVETGTTIGVTADGAPINAQQILMTEAQTTLSARSGQTVVFSGLISETKTHVERGAPILSDLPVIGPLFKFESDSSSRSELLIIMTPTLITDDEDLTAVNHDAQDRMHWCLSDVQEVYGSTDYGAQLDFGEEVETYYPDADPSGTLQPAVRNSRLESSGQPVIGEESRRRGRAVVEEPQSGSGSGTRAAGKSRRSSFLRR